MYNSGGGRLNSNIVDYKFMDFNEVTSIQYSTRLSFAKAFNISIPEQLRVERELSTAHERAIPELSKLKIFVKNVNTSKQY